MKKVLLIILAVASLFAAIQVNGVATRAESDNMPESFPPKRIVLD